jgi:predicted permease
MVGTFVVVLLAARYVLRRDLGTSALQALVVSMPAIPFVGATVLGSLVGDQQATLPVTAGTLAMNLVMAPLALILLAFGAADRGGSGAAPSGRSILLATLAEPVVWAPILAFALLLFGVGLPPAASQSLLLLGHVAAGVALFATGIVMFSRKVSLTPMVALNVFGRMILAPAGVWGLLSLSGLSHAPVREVVIMMALPAAALSVIFAVRFKTAEQEMSSTLFFANLLAPFSLGAFIWLSA